MLDPEHLAELRKTPGLSYGMMTGNVYHPSSNGLLPSSPQGQARKSPQNFEEMVVYKSSGVSDEDDLLSSPSSSHASRGKMVVSKDKMVDMT